MATKRSIIKTGGLESYLNRFSNSGGARGFQMGMQIKNLVEFIIEGSGLSFNKMSLDELQAILEGVVDYLQEQQKDMVESDNGFTSKLNKYLKE